MTSTRVGVVLCLVLMCMAGPASGTQSAAGVSPEQAERVWLDMERRLNAGDPATSVTAQDCGKVSTLRSLRYDTPTVLHFKNATQRDVTYYWVDYEGKRSQERTIKAGENQYVRTYVTHPFVVVDGAGACAAVYMPLAQPGAVTIADDRE